MQWHQAKHKVKTPVTAITKEKKKNLICTFGFTFKFQRWLVEISKQQNCVKIAVDFLPLWDVFVLTFWELIILHCSEGQDVGFKCEAGFLFSFFSAQHGVSVEGV